MSGQGYIATRLSGSERALALLEAWQRADADADIEIRIGQSASTKEPAVFVSIGADMHGFLVSEADVLIRVVSSAVDKFGAAAEAQGLPNLLYGLREGVREARNGVQP